MARFYQPDRPPEHQRVFQRPVQQEELPPEDEIYEEEDYQAFYEQPYEELYDQPEMDTEDYYLPEEDLLTEEELADMRRERWRMLSHLWDFLAVIAGTAVILLLMALLISLINWLYADISQGFLLWQTKI